MECPRPVPIPTRTIKPREICEMTTLSTVCAMSLKVLVHGAEGRAGDRRRADSLNHRSHFWVIRECMSINKVGTS